MLYKCFAVTGELLHWLKQIKISESVFRHRRCWPSIDPTLGLYNVLAWDMPLFDSREYIPSLNDGQLFVLTL